MNDMFEGSNFVSFVKSDLICRHGDFKFRKIIQFHFSFLLKQIAQQTILSKNNCRKSPVHR